MRRTPWGTRLLLPFLVAGLGGCGNYFEVGAPLVGVWGSEGAVAQLTAQGGTITFSCAYASLDAPLVPDNAGRVSVTGVRVAAGGAPFPDDPHTPVPSRISGVVSGSRLTLTIVALSATGQVVDPFTLRHGDQGKVYLCP